MTVSRICLSKHKFADAYAGVEQQQSLVNCRRLNGHAWLIGIFSPRREKMRLNATLYFERRWRRGYSHAAGEFRMPRRG
jgi:hypothetical protein